MKDSTCTTGLISKYQNFRLQEQQKKEAEKEQKYTAYEFDWGCSLKTSTEIAQEKAQQKQQEELLKNGFNFNFDLLDTFEKKTEKNKEAKTAEASKQEEEDKKKKSEDKKTEDKKIENTKSEKQVAQTKQATFGTTTLDASNPETQKYDAKNKSKVDATRAAESKYSTLYDRNAIKAAFGTCTIAEAKAGKYKTGGGSTFKGIRIAFAAESYKTFADNKKNWSEQQKKKAIEERKITLKEERERKQAPKAEKISSEAGNIDGSVNKDLGSQTKAGNTNLSSKDANLTAAKHSTGVGEALGQVTGGVEEIEQNFKNIDTDRDSEQYKNVLSGVEQEKKSENGALNDFDTAKSNAQNYESYQEKDAKAADKAVERSLEGKAEQDVAKQEVCQGTQKMNEANSKTNQGNQQVQQSSSLFEQAEEKAEEARQMQQEAKEFQAEGLKALKKATQQMAKGVKLTTAGDKQIGVGQSLIHAGVPLTYSIFTVAIGVAMISAGLIAINNGKNKVNQGNNQVRQGKQEREAGMKKFDKGTEKAKESKEKQDEAKTQNEQALTQNEQGQALISNAEMIRLDGKTQKNRGETDFHVAVRKTDNETRTAQRHTENANKSCALVQKEIKKTEACLNTIMSAQANAEKLTGIEGNGNRLEGVGSGESSNINPDKQNGLSSANMGESGVAGINLGEAFNLSDAMKSHAYKKKLEAKKEEKKDEKKDEKNKDKLDIKKSQSQNNTGMSLGLKQNNNKSVAKNIRKLNTSKVQSIFATT